LLGDLDDREHETIEEHLLTDRAFEARLTDAETALIDDYVFDLLSDSEAEKFRTNFILNDERRKQLLVAKALKTYVSDPQPVPTNAGWQFRQLPQFLRYAVSIVQRHKVLVTLSVVAVLLLLVFTPLLIKVLRTPGQPDHRTEIERALVQLNHAPPPITKESSAEITLQPTLLRNTSKLKKVTLTAETKFVRLQLENDGNPAETYQVSIRKIGEAELFVIGELRPESSAYIRVIIPAEFLPRADYQIELYGSSAVGKPQQLATYYLRVLK
jgi:hypothetical protein